MCGLRRGSSSMHTSTPSPSHMMGDGGRWAYKGNHLRCRRPTPASASLALRQRTGLKKPRSRPRHAPSGLPCTRPIDATHTPHTHTAPKGRAAGGPHGRYRHSDLLRPVLLRPRPLAERERRRGRGRRRASKMIVDRGVFAPTTCGRGRVGADRMWERACGRRPHVRWAWARTWVTCPRMPCRGNMLSSASAGPSQGRTNVVEESAR